MSSVGRRRSALTTPGVFRADGNASDEREGTAADEDPGRGVCRLAGPGRGGGAVGRELPAVAPAPPPPPPPPPPRGGGRRGAGAWAARAGVEPEGGRRAARAG